MFIFGGTGRSFSSAVGSLLAAPANVNLFNQGGPNTVSGTPANTLTNVLGIQWDPVSGAAGYDVQRVDAQTGAASVLATNVQPVTFTIQISGTTATVTNATAGQVVPGVRLVGAGLQSGTMIDAAQLTGSGNGNGTYHVNISQTIGPLTCTQCQYIDTTATNAVRPAFDDRTTGYWYQVATRNSGGSTGSYSTNMTMYQFQNGYSNITNSDLSFGSGTTNYTSTNGSPISASGKCTEVTFTSYGFQPATNAPLTAQWTSNTQWAGYFFIDINPGSNPAVNMYIGPPPCRTPEGDVFSWNNPNSVDLFSTAYGPTVVANTWSRRKVPMYLLALCCNPITASQSGSTLTVTSCSADLFGNPGRVDNGGWVSGPGITVPQWVHASGQSAPTGTFTMFVGTGAGTGASLTAASTGANWLFSRYDEYKFAINPSGQPLTGSVYFGDWGFSRT